MQYFILIKNKNIDFTNPEVIRELKQEAANIVKNTVPNYAYVRS